MSRVEQQEAPPSEARPEVNEPFHGAFLWTAAGLVIVALWITPMFSSLWNDEFGTWWVVNGSVRQTVTRAEAVQGQSPLYYLIAWGVRHVTGPNEFGMRLPSLVFSIVAAFFIYRIARRLIDAETARIAVIAFAVWPSVEFAASDMRPYALATLVVVASTWALIGWLDTGRLYAAAGYVLLAALMPYVHPVFGVVLIPHAVYALSRIREGSTAVRRRDVVLATGAIVILVIPVVLELIALWRRREISSLPRAATVPWVVEVLVPPAFVGAVVIGGIIAAPKLRIGTDLRQLPRSTLILMIGWLLIPTAILLGLSVLWSIDLLEARYLLCMTPAAVLLAAVAARALEPAQVRRMIVLLVVVFSVLDLAAPVKSGDFRGAASLVRSVADERSVILVPSGFQESMDQRWFVDPNRQSLLTAATSFYPVPGRVVPLPMALDATTLDFVRTQVGNAIAQTDKVLVVSQSGSSYGPWFDEYMGQRGWTSHQVGGVDLFNVTEFTRGIS